MITIGSNTKIKNSIIGCNRSKKERELIKQIEELTNNWRLLEKVIKDMLFTTPHENQMLDFILDKMKEIKEGKK